MAERPLKTNKLRATHDSITTWPLPTSRKEIVVVSRLRISHTTLTDSYLFNRQPASNFIIYHTFLTIPHFLLYCPKYTSFWSLINNLTSPTPSHPSTPFNFPKTNKSIPGNIRFHSSVNRSALIFQFCKKLYRAVIVKFHFYVLLRLCRSF